MEPWIFERKRKVFKEGLVQSYSYDHRFLLNSGAELKLPYFEFDVYDETNLRAAKGFEVSKYGSYKNGAPVAQIGSWDANAIDVDLLDNQLKVIRKDSAQTLDNWVLDYHGHKKDALYYKILQQLSTDTVCIEDLRSKLRKLEIKEVDHQDGRTSIFIARSHEYGGYELIRTKKALKENEHMIKIDEPTYLKKILNMRLILDMNI